MRPSIGVSDSVISQHQPGLGVCGAEGRNQGRPGRAHEKQKRASVGPRVGKRNVGHQVRSLKKAVAERRQQDPKGEPRQEWPAQSETKNKPTMSHDWAPRVERTPTSWRRCATANAVTPGRKCRPAKGKPPSRQESRSTSTTVAYRSDSWAIVVATVSGETNNCGIQGSHCRADQLPRQSSAIAREGHQHGCGRQTRRVH